MTPLTPEERKVLEALSRNQVNPHPDLTEQLRKRKLVQCWPGGSGCAVTTKGLMLLQKPSRPSPV